jgi:hypothetical protein
MKKLAIASVVMLFVLLGFAMLAAQEKPWFDMENCAFCKTLTAEEGLMDHFKKWEHHNVDNGSVSISVVDKEYVPAFKRAMHNMEEVSKKLQQGEMLPMCGMCEAYGELMQMGAKWDEVESDDIFVSLIYSDKADVVAAIHAMTDRTNAEMKKMEQEKAPAPEK